MSISVPVDDVLFKPVVGRQIEASTKPPDRGPAGPIAREGTEVGMHRGSERIPRVDDQRDRDGLKALA